MIKTKDFYKSLNECEKIFKQYGFRKDKEGSYSRNSFKLIFQLNKWGWDDENGWGFFMRAIDERYEDEYGIFDWNGTLDITPSTLGLDHETTLKLYKDQPLGVREVFHNGQWISFYDQGHLDRVLAYVLPKALEMTVKWVSKQRRVVFSGARKPEKLTKERRGSIEQEFKDLFDD